MKHFHLFWVFQMIFLLNAAAQNDTLLFENFQTDPAPEMLQFPSGNDEQWVNLDNDGLPDANNYPKNWFQALDFKYSTGQTITGDTNFVFCSSSWLFNFANGNRNWLILPPLDIIDESAVLSWKSAPFQCPLYTDGYSVLVSTTTNDPNEGSFADTLFRAAQNIPPWPATNSLNAEDYLFSEGYIHADGLTIPEYVYYNTSAQDTAYTGLLEPHSISLAAYAGDHIYIAFVHDSDDDYLLAIDDILVRGTSPSATTNPDTDIRLNLYPNPVTEVLICDLYIKDTDNITILITNSAGQDVLRVLTDEKMSSGGHTFEINMHHLISDMYYLKIITKNDVISHQFIKH